MATLTTTAVSHVREDIGDVISVISPEQTPFKTSIGKTKASNTYHENLLDELAPANKDNAREEGYVAPAANNTGPKRVGNATQIFGKEVSVSNTLDAVNTAGTNTELSRQMAKAGKELNRDIEAALVSGNASVISGTRKMAGAEAWISTNVISGAGGSTPGFVGGLVGTPTEGTKWEITEEKFNELIEKIFMAGGDPDLVIAPPSLKQAISKFNGNGTKFQNADSKEIFAGIDYYVSDFGRHKIIPHRFMSEDCVIAFDKSLWAVATLRSVKKTELGVKGDSTNYMLTTELTLESRNEAGNGKLADVVASL